MNPMTPGCPRCGASTSLGQRFCAKCGIALEVSRRFSGSTAAVPIPTQPIAALSQSPPFAEATPSSRAFRVQPDGGVPRPESPTPEAEVLVLDLSGSMDGDKLKALCAASREHILRKMHIDRHDYMAIVAFSDDARVVCEWSRLTNPSPLLAAVSSLSAEGSTCFTAGFEAANVLFSRCPGTERAGPLRRLLLYTDGKNVDGDPTEIAEDMKSRGILVQAVGFGDEEGDVDVDLLKELVSDLDGKQQYWFCRDRRELTQTFAQLSGKTRVFPRTGTLSSVTSPSATGHSGIFRTTSYARPAQ